MTQRETLIVRAILNFLKSLDGGQAVEPMIHAAIVDQIVPRLSLTEFNSAVVTCGDSGWTIGVLSKVTRKMKWSISDQGIAALAEL